MNQLTPEFWIGNVCREFAGFFQTARDLLVDLILVLIVVSQRAVDLSQ